MKKPRLTLRQLQVFREVAERGSTIAAADAVSLSQSAASAAVNELERMLGLPLFDRIGKRLLLNDDGRSLLPQARALLDGAAAIERWGREADPELGSIRIGASTTIGNYLLPELLAGFRDVLPAAARAHWNARVSIANSATVVAAVAAFELDFGLIEGPCRHPELSVTPWLEDELIVVAAPGHPIAGKLRRGRIPLAALRNEAWLLREAGSGTRETVEQLLIPHLKRLRPGIEFGNTEAIKRAAVHGLGIACLSRCVVQDLIEDGSLVALRTSLPRLSRRFLRIMHGQKHRTRGLDRLIAYLEAPTRQG